MQADEIELLLECLRKSSQHLGNPMLLPLFLIELKVHYFAVLLEKRAEGIENIEYMTGMRHGFSSNPRRNTVSDEDREKLRKELDFDPITQKLTGVTGTLSFCDMTFASSLRALELISALRRRISANVDQHREDIDAETQRALDRRTAYVRELIVGAQAHGAVLSARTRAQVQTVYSMIGQKDNKLNIETAAASQKIAEISLRHNSAMKDMAEDSKNVAILTRKDSTDMRIIAVVTLMFLPGTFMATLFSSGFFNFLPDRSSQVVSKWIWLYFTLTGTTTLIVFLAWYQFSKHQNKAMLTMIRGNKETSPFESEQIQYDKDIHYTLSATS
ncbi:uncharacterized protein Z518_01509 [Rhinocladiella mackenziei CBS 650.93]|uniref:Rhinocladiella mackenziei CBS 650.93 unplaced genomic scaffold supercont1.1, whole genome shotgun sequence n=1 Tax=Rhinocladiella mackenziei CBS 650.93 TaxID=1442369 RepID=A0A0D2G660_9EURO|nr:uncharacterized protein Z518_01509 [Rhinocladiella mackenziei CBS 650.93]KIX10427.1 hypothetical protein Z518_01509 [Rhinocladiella mackenziei CBS 650.93]